MSTEPEPQPAAAEETGSDRPETSGRTTTEADGAPGGGGTDEVTSGEAVGEGADAGDGARGGELSEAEEALAAQRELRERIEERKAKRRAPIESGTKLTGKTADLLAAVRAVESGERPTPVAFDSPAGTGTPPPGPVSAPAPVRASAPAPVSPAAGSGPTAAALQAVREVLAEGSAPAELAPQTCVALGEDAAGLLRDDPWQLLRVSGVRPDKADGFARALLGAECGPDDERRGRAVVVWLLEQAALAGHTALDASALADALGRYTVTGPDAAVESAIEDGDVLVFQDALDASGTSADAPDAADASGTSPDASDEEDAEAARPVRVLIGLERYALAEESLADGLARLVNSRPKEGLSEPSAWEPAISAASGSTAELLRAVAGHTLVLHSGGEAARAEPASLVAAARSLGLRVYAATHTADGRRRFADLVAAAESGSREKRDGTVTDGPLTDGPVTGGPVTGGTAVTVSGLLSGAEGPARDAEGRLAVDLLVVLDAPQLDVESAAVLVESLPDGARLVLSGDQAVLGSAGPGRVFADLLAARVCPQIASRTPDPGPIGELVSGIGIGELNQVEAPGKEVVIVPVRDPGEAVHRTVQLVAESVPRAFGIPAEETQVITPGHGGAAGTRVLNAALKERLNPGPGRFGGFDPGDLVAYSPAPGRTTPGRVIDADAAGLRLECDGATVVVPKERVEQWVRHGWALTAHQAVGLRRAAAVVVLPGDATGALTRPWVYTAFGRGERHLSVVHGVDQALPRAVSEVLAKPRTTRLPALLRAQVPSES